MAKLIVIRKSQDKITLVENNKVIADIIIADSSRTTSVNLSIRANDNIKISKVPQQPKDLNKRVRPNMTNKHVINKLHGVRTGRFVKS